VKSSIRLISILILIVLASPVILLLKGCGKEELGSAECPSGSVVANSTDKLIGPTDATLTLGAPFYGGTVLYAPLVFKVTDVNGVPRTKVCVVLYTDGFFYTDDQYSTLLPGVGPMARVAKKTDEWGNVFMYWSTQILPSSGSNEITGDTWVQAYSGTLQDEYKVDWTVSPVKSLTITTATLPDGQVGVLYTAFIVATGTSSNTAPYTWTAVGLPASLSISGTSLFGVISGTPAAGDVGTYSVFVTVTDTSAPPITAIAFFTLVIN
jgi:hypothetical protein